MAANITHTVVRTYKNQGSTARTLSETITGVSEGNHALALAGSSTNHNTGWTYTRANLKSLSITSDQAVTLYTNAASGSSPTDTIAIAAGQVLIWTQATDLVARCPFSADVTNVFITNAGGTAANIFIDALLSA
jgi:hypothetical protein